MSFTCPFQLFYPLPHHDLYIFTFRKEGTKTMEQRVLTVNQLAQELSLPRSWIYSRTRTGEIPMLRAGKHIRFVLSEVMAYLKQQTQQHEAQQ